MKKVISLLSFSVLIWSCNEKPVKEVTQEEFTIPEGNIEVRSGDQNLPGYAKINRSDCLSCHKGNDKFVGPSYTEIADRYTDQDIEVLATKIIEGSKGTWGEVPMLAHPTLPKEDAIEMVQYIMSLKKK